MLNQRLASAASVAKKSDFISTDLKIANGTLHSTSRKKIIDFNF